MRTIDADAILKHPLLHTMRKGDVIKLIQEAPTIKPERPKAVWVYQDTGYRDQTRQMDIERFVCGHCYKQHERVERHWWDKLTPPKKKFCSECGAEMDTEKLVRGDAFVR